MSHVAALCARIHIEKYDWYCYDSTRRHVRAAALFLLWSRLRHGTCADDTLTSMSAETAVVHVREHVKTLCYELPQQRATYVYDLEDAKLRLLRQPRARTVRARLQHVMPAVSAGQHGELPYLFIPHAALAASSERARGTALRRPRQRHTFFRNMRACEVRTSCTCFHSGQLSTYRSTGVQARSSWPLTEFDVTYLLRNHPPSSYTQFTGRQRKRYLRRRDRYS